MRCSIVLVALALASGSTLVSAADGIASKGTETPQWEYQKIEAGGRGCPTLDDPTKAQLKEFEAVRMCLSYRMEEPDSWHRQITRAVTAAITLAVPIVGAAELYMPKRRLRAETNSLA